MSDVPTFGCPNLEKIATRIAYIFQLYSMANQKTDRTFLVTLYFGRNIVDALLCFTFGILVTKIKPKDIVFNI